MSSIPPELLEGALSNTSLTGIGNVSRDLAYICQVDSFIANLENEMSSQDMNNKSREDVLAAREAKKLNKQKAKKKDENQQNIKKDVTETEEGKQMLKLNNEAKGDTTESSKTVKSEIKPVKKDHQVKEISEKPTPKSLPKGKDEVDRAVKEEKAINLEKAKLLKDSIKDKENVTKCELNLKENKSEPSEQSKEQIKAERAAKKAAKQAKKKGDNVDKDINKNCLVTPVPISTETVEELNSVIDKNVEDVTVREVVETLKGIVNVAKEFQAVTDRVKAMELSANKV